MGRMLLACRLAARDVRRRPAATVLLLLAIAAATTVLTLGLALHGITSQPYQRTRAATNGPDEVAYLATPAQATALARAAGVTGASGPYPVAGALVRAGGLVAAAEAQGRGEAAAGVDRPALTAGTWVRPGGVVLERAFAEALGVRAGDRITLNGRWFTVTGIAVTAASPPYPDRCAAGCVVPFPPGAGRWRADVGLAWVTEPDARALAASDRAPPAYVESLAIRDPAAARQVAAAYNDAHHGAGAPFLVPWQSIRAADGVMIQAERQILDPGAWITALIAVASVAVLAGGRMTEATRRLGLLKAVGGTPGLVAAVLLAENLAVALAAAGAGLAAGWLAAPLLTRPGAFLVGAPGAPSLTAPDAGLAVAVAVAVALAATLAPAIRAARASAASALADPARPPRREGALIAASARLPVPLLLGLRLAARRPRRAALGAATVTLAAGAIVAVLTFRASAAAASRAIAGGTNGPGYPVFARDEQVLTVLTVVLLTLAAVHAIVTAWATALDARRPAALAGALGATARQVAAALAAAQVLPALPGAAAGIPLGIAALAVANGGGRVTVPPAWWLAGATAGTVLAVAALAAIPALIGARRPVTEILKADAALSLSAFRHRRQVAGGAPEAPVGGDQRRVQRYRHGDVEGIADGERPGRLKQRPERPPAGTEGPQGVNARCGACEPARAAEPAGRRQHLGVEMGRRRHGRGREPGLKVVLLVAAGTTNAEIAGELFASVRTVEHHVQHTLAKPGFRSRADSAARVAAGRLPAA